MKLVVDRLRSRLPPPDRLVFSTDTHSGAAYPFNLKRHVDWVNANASARRIVALLCSGDFTNGGADAYWADVVSSWNTLTVPGIPCPGNHDYDGSDWTSRTTKISTYLPTASMATLIAAYQAGVSSNTAHLITVNGRQWLVLALEFWPRDAVVVWALGILAANLGKPTIILTHEALTRTGVLSTPAYYSQSGTGINFGQDINAKLVVPYPQICLVFSGHDIPYTAKRLTITRDDGSKCSYCYRNTQDYPQGSGPSGSPFLTEVELDEVNNRCGLRYWAPAMGMELPVGNDVFQLF